MFLQTVQMWRFLTFNESVDLTGISQGQPSPPLHQNSEKKRTRSTDMGQNKYTSSRTEMCKCNPPTHTNK